MARTPTRRRRRTLTLVGLAVTVAYLFPVYWMVATSVKTQSAIFASPPQLVPLQPVLQAYRDTVLGNPAILRGFLNSLVVSTGTMLLTLVLAAPAAYALARLRLRFVGVAVLVLLVAQMLPTINLAVPLFLIFRKLHLVDTYPALILANTLFTLPLAIIILRPFFLGLPGEIEEAARIDGCGQLRTFWSVILPLTRPGLITVATISFVLTWGELVFGLTLTTKENMQPITVGLVSLVGQYGTRWNDLMAVATAVAIPIIVVFAVLQRQIVSGLTTGTGRD
ncbi:carbohydrate ABC transporter permease [Pseudonocardia kunmingensis]|uniref:Carbohydrate ABC transporter membrane protein 2 (CUT1 family) n=1 Tax=Pseudonocardia kunmingensis TaxID=630975 RepID=A0A543DVP0_9PSEU|nr:carbohydrate ABC transporter permease [Pseudonocardia kunmingensis]TQM13398.1 carbohydrate ABC transporter membrane protein 2 (CUT1 family) [Pseudonocardia kunmingensis]